VKDITGKIDNVNKHYKKSIALAEKLDGIPKNKKEKARELRSNALVVGRERVEISRAIRRLGFKQCRAQRLIDRVNKTVEALRGLERQFNNLERRSMPTRSDDLKKEYRRQQRVHRAEQEKAGDGCGRRFPGVAAHAARDHPG